MSRRGVCAALLGGLLVLPVLTASPALAVNDNLGPQEGADLYSGLSTLATILLFVVLPLVLLLLIALVVLLPGMLKAERYRPSRGWSAAPVWFAGPPDPVAAVETAEPGAMTRGGASGDW